MKRIISVLLAVLMLAPCALFLYSCAENSENKTTVTGTGASSQKAWLDNLPEDLYFDGATYDIALAGYAADPSAANYWTLVADESSGDAVKNEIFKRNQKIEARLGVKIVISATATPSLTQSNLLNSLQAGTDDYDLVSGPQEYDYDLASRGLLQNIYKYSDYIDLSAEYWGSDVNREYEYNGYVGFVTSPATIAYYSAWYCIFANLDIYEKHLFAEYGSIYDIVRRGDWTIDLFMDMIEKAYIDNGDIQDKEDVNDQLGLYMSKLRINPLAVGMGVHFSERTADGGVEITINRPVTVTACEKLTELLSLKGALIEPNGNAYINEFGNGKYLFGLETVGSCQSLLEMQKDFTVLPLPKLEAGESTKYSNHFNGWFQHFGIPIGAPDGVMSAAVLEALTAESYRSVMPVYYDEALKYRYTRDDDTADMIDLIRNSAYVDFAIGNTEDLMKISDFFYYHDITNISSQLKSETKILQKLLGKLLEKYDEHNKAGI